MSDLQRTVRLTSGGIPLPDAFGAVMTELMDHGPATAGDLASLLADALKWKEKRIYATWDTWGDFARDILGQLTDARLVTSDPRGRYSVYPGTLTGVRYDVIGEAGIGLTLWDRKARQERDANSVLRTEIRRLLEAHGEASENARQSLATAELHLSRALGEEQRPRRIRRGSLPKEDRGEPPASRELALRKYGLDGNPPFRNTRKEHRFGPDGKRACRRCQERKGPEEFPVYWGDHSGRGQDDCWYLRSTCIPCMNELEELKFRK